MLLAVRSNMVHCNMASTPTFMLCLLCWSSFNIPFTYGFSDNGFDRIHHVILAILAIVWILRIVEIIIVSAINSGTEAQESHDPWGQSRKE